MGKTLRWFRVLLEGRKGSNSPEVVDVKQTKEKKKWGFVRSFREKTTMEKIKSEKRERVSLDPNKRSIAVAAATSAVAEAAVAAAQAAVEVVKMTAGSGRSTVAPSYSAGWKAELATVKIQSAFRGYLARKALKALRGLVKLQALVRGHIVRKQTAETLKCMQSLLKAQARARASRTCHGNIFPAHPSHAQSPTTPEKYELNVRTSGAKHDKITGFERNSSKTGSIDLSYAERIRINSNWLQHCISGRDSLYQISPSKSLLVDDEKNAKILEIDNGKPFINSNHGDRICKHHSSPPLDYEYPPEFSFEVENLDNSPQFHSASSRLGSAKGGPFTPSKSDSNSMCTFFSGYSDYPNYMANTESSKAKVRSISAPKQRPEFEKSGSVKRGLTYDLRSKSSSLHAKFVSKAYPGSGRLDGMQMACFNGTY